MKNIKTRTELSSVRQKMCELRIKSCGPSAVMSALAFCLAVGNAHAQVKNIFNKDPANVPNGPGGSAYGNPSTNQGLYDFLGRVFRVGVRMNF